MEGLSPEKLPSAVSFYEKKEERTSEKIPLPDFGEYTKLNEIAEEVAELTGDWDPVEIYNPGNSKEEKEKFLDAYQKGEEYNPQFIYPRALEIYSDPSFIKTKERLYELLSTVKEDIRSRRDISKAERLYRLSLYSKLKDDIATTKIIEGIATRNDELTKEGMYEKYTHFKNSDDPLVKLAENVYHSLIEGKSTIKAEPLLSKEEIKFLKGTKVSPEETKEAFEWALKKLGILYPENPDGFRVIIDEKARTIDVRNKSKEGKVVVVPKDRKRTRKKLLELINHEIVGHARQSYNSEKIFKLGGGKLKFDDEVMYEGLAMRHEKDADLELFGEVNKYASPFYVLAIDLAQKGLSFYQIFDRLVDMKLHVKLKIPPDQKIDRESLSLKKEDWEKIYDWSWGRVIRVMRGHSDTRNLQAYALPKDIAYLAGYQIDKGLVQLQTQPLFQNRRINPAQLNEMAGLVKGGLLALAEFDLSEPTISQLIREGKYIPFQDLARKYYDEFLRPQFLKSQESIKT